MSESLPLPDPRGFPDLATDPTWVRTVPAHALIARIFRASGAYPTQWHDLRDYGPLDARFDPHPEPVGQHAGVGVLYGVLVDGAVHETRDEAPIDESAALFNGALAAVTLEVFQQYRIIDASTGTPTLAGFRTARPLRLLDLSDSDWIAAARGNAAISSGDRRMARAWARAIAARYPELDGVVSASSVIPAARVIALWEPARTALPRFADWLIRLDSPALGGALDRIAQRYAYDLM